MANTYTSLHYHVLFSTKNRYPWLVPDIEGRIWAFIGGIARKHKMTALQVGGVEDHIHTLVTAPPTIAPCQVAQFLKICGVDTPFSTVAGATVLSCSPDPGVETPG
jgi:REP element-mobilizing transposase RayT